MCLIPRVSVVRRGSMGLINGNMKTSMNRSGTMGLIPRMSGREGVWVWVDVGLYM